MSKAAMPPWYWPRAAYVHIPFCMHHCGYCDFAIAVGQEHQIELYLDALEAELATLGEPQQVRTIFLGGGTPTYLQASQLDRLLRMLRRWLPLEAANEVSIEANPETITPEKVDVLADLGVGRVSLGAQSFHPQLLQALERPHQPADIARAVETIRRRIPSISLDLIFGAPGQTEKDWREDLRWALALAPDHLSTYGLTYEKGTPLWKRRQRGEVIPLEEDAERQLYALAMETLDRAGFEQYEISNFARPGARCRHNEVYWANEAYFGFGMGAARYVRGRRELNSRDLRTYIRKALSGEPATFQSEELSPRERAQETMAIQLRRIEGISREQFEHQTGFPLEDIAAPALPHLIAQGLLTDTGTRIHLTHEGKFVADGIIEKLL